MMRSTKVKFGDVVRKVSDKVDPVEDGLTRYVAGEHMDTDELVIRRFGNVGEGYLGPAFHMRFKPGHILYGSRRTYLRKVSMADFEGVCSNTTFVLEPKTSTLSPKYLLYLMSTERFHQNSIALSKGSTNPYINFSDLTNFEFELPSLDEQERIVELLSAVDEHAEALRIQLNVAVETRKSVLQNLMNKGGDHWVEVTIGDIAVFVGIRSDPKSLQISTTYVALEHLESGAKEIAQHGDLENVLSLVTPFEPSDTLFGKLRPYLHKVAFATFPGVCSTEIFVLRAKKECLPSFLYLVLNQDETVAYCVDRSAGTRMPRVSSKDLASIQLLLPPIDEQNLIVQEISKFDLLIEETNASLTATKQLRSALLNKEIS